MIEVIDLSNRLYIQANSKKGSRPPKPIKVPRPEGMARPKAPKGRPFSELAARLTNG